MGAKVSFGWIRGVGWGQRTQVIQASYLQISSYKGLLGVHKGS